MLNSIECVLGICTFAGKNIYDTHLAIQEYESGNADHLGMSVEFLLNTFNILIRVLQLSLNNKKKKKKY